MVCGQLIGIAVIGHGMYSTEELLSEVLAGNIENARPIVTDSEFLTDAVRGIRLNSGAGFAKNSLRILLFAYFCLAQEDLLQLANMVDAVIEATRASPEEPFYRTSMLYELRASIFCLSLGKSPNKAEFARLSSALLRAGLEIDMDSLLVSEQCIVRRVIDFMAAKDGERGSH